jgi:VCBS repeat-containing protein
VVDPRSITFTLAGKPGVTVNVVEDKGNLDFTLTTTLKADLSGLFFDFTNSKLSSLTAAGPLITQFVAKADGVSNLANGVNLNGQKVPNFDVGMEFGLAGIGSKNQNIQSESFVLSDTAHNLSIDDLHPTGKTGTVGVRDLGSGQKLEAVAPYAPTATTTAATPYQVTTLEETPITIQASSLATDLNSGAVLKVDKIGTGAQGPQYGTVQINNDGSLTYTPTTLDYKVNGILTGNQDAFQVGVKDNFGGTVTSFVTVHATPVADAPAVKVQVLTPHDGDPVTEVRLLVTAQSGDFGTVNAGSDFIQSIALGGTAATDATQITDSLGLLSGVFSGRSRSRYADGQEH